MPDQPPVSVDLLVRMAGTFHDFPLAPADAQPVAGLLGAIRDESAAMRGFETVDVEPATVYAAEAP